MSSIEQTAADWAIRFDRLLIYFNFTAQDMVRFFVREHPEWEVRFYIEMNPPVLELQFWLRPDAFPRRKVLVGPTRCQTIKPGEMDIPATFVATFADDFILSPRERRSDAGKLVYRLIPKPYVHRLRRA